MAESAAAVMIELDLGVLRSLEIALYLGPCRSDDVDR